MKFPKSVHAEGWLDRIEAAGGARQSSAAPADADHRTRLDERLDVGAAKAAPVAPEPSRTALSPWVIGVGAGAALIVLAVSMSRNLSPADAPAPPPVVTGQVQPEAAQPASPEDAQLAAAPTAAGPVVPALEAMPPAPTVQPAVKAPKAEAPVARTLSARPETLSQAALPPAMPLESSRPVLLAAKTMPQLPPSAVTTEAAPPVAQPPVELEDAGITAKVRTALSTDAVLSAVPIAVSTEHGVVKLEGEAPDAQARERATVVAAATTGVKGVDNRLTLPPVAGLGGVQPQG
jgi:hypothetical protein